MHRSFFSDILDILDRLMNDLWFGNWPVQKLLNFFLKCFDAVDCIVRRGLSGKNVHQLGHIEVTSGRNVRNLDRGLVFKSFNVRGVLVDNSLVYDQKRNRS